MSVSLNIGITQIGQIGINVYNLERSIVFYRDVLAFFQCDEVRLMLSQLEKPELDHPGSILY